MCFYYFWAKNLDIKFGPIINFFRFSQIWKFVSLKCSIPTLIYYFSPKNALNAIKKKLSSPNPHTALYALELLESIVKNCGSAVHEELTTKQNCDMLHELVVTTQHEEVRKKLLELIQTWNHAFRKNPKHSAIKVSFVNYCWENFYF